MVGARPASGWARRSNEAAYRQVRLGVTQLLAGGERLADSVVPACPEWAVRDLVAHLVEMCAMAVGKLGGRPAGPPNGALGLAELRTEWSKVGAHLEQLIAERKGGSGRLVLMDAFTHELDLRQVVRVPAPVDHPAWPIALDVLVGGFSAEVSRRGLPALRLRTGSAEWVAGEGVPAGTLSADQYDLYRSLAGRRTLDQISELCWSRQPSPWQPAFTWGPFTLPTRPSEGVSHT